MPEIWWEAPMEGSVLIFFKAEWKVSDTGSAHWASSSYAWKATKKEKRVHAVFYQVGFILILYEENNGNLKKIIIHTR
jgi:hypothetical protein